MGRAIIGVLESRGLNLKNMIGSCTDSTNSMSGVWNGAMAFVRNSIEWEEGELREECPRNACALHVVHLGKVAADATLYFGKMPAKLDRAHEHLWNFFWDLYKLFGKPHTGFYWWVYLCAENGLELTNTWKPVGTRWQFEGMAATWTLANLETIVWLYNKVPLHSIDFISVVLNRLLLDLIHIALNIKTVGRLAGETLYERSMAARDEIY